MAEDNDIPAQGQPQESPATAAPKSAASPDTLSPSASAPAAKDGIDTKAAPAPANNKAKRSGISLGGLLFHLVLVAGIVVVGYYVYEQDKAVNVLFDQQNALVQQRNDSVARLNALQTTNQALQDSLDTIRQETADLVAQQNTEIERLQNELVSTRLRINSTNPGASQEWLLAEAASLLRLARQHLIVSRNMTTAQALYIAADDVLKAIDDPAIFAVRETLAGELASIRAVNEVDVRSIYLQLGAIAEQVNRLQVTNDLAVQVNSGEQVTLSAGEVAADVGLFSRLVNRVRNSLNNYFVVRRRDVPIQPLMTPGQEAALMQSIRLQIEQARTALLRGEQEIYTAGLGEAREAIASWLAGDTGVLNNILDTLDNLRTRRIVTEVPPLNRSLAALEQILSARDTSTAAPAAN